VSSEQIGVSGLAGRYATALFELADEARALDPVSGDLAQLASMIADSADLARLVKSPVIGRDDQGRAMEAVMQAAGISELTRRFVGVVARNRRLFALPDMIRAFRALLAERRGEVTAEVVSATPLTSDQQEAVRQQIAATMGAKVALTTRVDPEILGGLVVRVGSRMIDSSIRTKLQRLQVAMKGAA
jgi:F-type H+-transporting ATPase subunit delta